MWESYPLDTSASTIVIADRSRETPEGIPNLVSHVCDCLSVYSKLISMKIDNTLAIAY